MLRCPLTLVVKPWTCPRTTLCLCLLKAWSAFLRQIRLGMTPAVFLVLMWLTESMYLLRPSVMSCAMNLVVVVIGLPSRGCTVLRLFALRIAKCSLLSVVTHPLVWNLSALILSRGLMRLLIMVWMLQFLNGPLVSISDVLFGPYLLFGRNSLNTALWKLGLAVSRRNMLNSIVVRTLRL